MPTIAKSASAMSSGASTEVTPEQKSKSAECWLYRKVLIQALKDAASRDEARRLETGRWVVSKDFLDVCRWGQVKAENMKAGFRQVLLSQANERRARADRLCLILGGASVS